MVGYALPRHFAAVANAKQISFAAYEHGRTLPASELLTVWMHLPLYATSLA